MEDQDKKWYQGRKFYLNVHHSVQRKERTKYRRDEIELNTIIPLSLNYNCIIEVKMI